jgi:hypothetical protein
VQIPTRLPRLRRSMSPAGEDVEAEETSEGLPEDPISPSLGFAEEERPVVSSRGALALLLARVRVSNDLFWSNRPLRRRLPRRAAWVGL